MFGNLMQHYIGPIFIMGIFTVLGPILPYFGSLNSHLEWNWFGNYFSWITFGTMVAWATFSLWVPSKLYRGPTTSFGMTPVYSSNGMEYYTVTTILYALLLYIKPQIAVDITNNFSNILVVCNCAGLIFCIYLFIQGHYFPQVNENKEIFPIAYAFYRGMETHPRFMGMDVKQLVICRFSLMAWQLLIMNFFVVGVLSYGYSFALLTMLIMPSVYLAKFFWWETGYFNTLDIIHDRAGYYLCWGCFVWVPAMYSFASYYLAFRKPTISDSQAVQLLIISILCLALNYVVDWEKEYFRENEGNCNIWGKPATFIKATYKTDKGTKQSILLTSGFWGIARHLNYVFEILAAFTWSFPAIGYGITPFAYPIFLSILLFHRIFRDEERCKKKYGKYWNEYCEKVPYRLIPYLF